MGTLYFHKNKIHNSRRDWVLTLLYSLCIHKKIYCVVDHKHAPSNLKRKNIHYLPIDFNKELSKQIALTLFEQKISSVIVEGGTKTLALFLGAGLWGGLAWSKGAFQVPLIIAAIGAFAGAVTLAAMHLKNRA